MLDSFCSLCLLTSADEWILFSNRVRECHRVDDPSRLFFWNLEDRALKANRTVEQSIYRAERRAFYCGSGL